MNGKWIPIHLFLLSRELHFFHTVSSVSYLPKDHVSVQYVTILIDVYTQMSRQKTTVITKLSDSAQQLRHTSIVRVRNRQYVRWMNIYHMIYLEIV